MKVMPTPEQKRQQRVAQLSTAFSQLDMLRSDAERFGHHARVGALKRAMALIDAVSCIEECAPPFAQASDAPLVERLREIARDRDIFGERRAAEKEAGESNV